jgi:ubiquinone/menaquinone biosynthesis C-methylase UbiE
MSPLNTAHKVQEQFHTRAETFNISAVWISDQQLIAAHAEAAGMPSGKCLEVCCGTGQVGKSLRARGWSVIGIDISQEMLSHAQAFFSVCTADAHKLPFKENTFSLVVCRQAYHFLCLDAFFVEIVRVLQPGGVFIGSMTVPFSKEDELWLKKIHQTKQPLLRHFLTEADFVQGVRKSGLVIEASQELTVRENIQHWMKNAPEIPGLTQQKVCGLIESAPEAYKRLHAVSVEHGIVFENWRWIVVAARRIKA